MKDFTVYLFEKPALKTELCWKILERPLYFSELYNQRVQLLLRCSCLTDTSEITAEHKSQLLSCEMPHVKYLCICPKVLTLLLSLKDIFSMMHSAFDRWLSLMLAGFVWLSSYLCFENVPWHIFWKDEFSWKLFFKKLRYLATWAY